MRIFFFTVLNKKDYWRGLFFLCFIIPFSSIAQSKKELRNTIIEVSIDLVNVTNDKVHVNVTLPTLATNEITYHFAKIIPGTYAIADYGRFIENIQAFDIEGAKIPIERPDSNTVIIRGSKKIARLSYWVNDTFDVETGEDVFGSKEMVIFSPAGTNILAGEQFWLNLCGFVGYFTGQEELPYQLSIKHPSDLFGSTAAVDIDNSLTNDRFYYSRFAEVVDNPIMYSKPDTATFNVDGMEVLLSVYAPNSKTSAHMLKPTLEKMVIAQKKFLGKLNTTKKYAVLAYLSSSGNGEPKGIGALEHNNSTTAVFRSTMTSKDLISVIGHEFFHTVTPLKVHSEEIRSFNFEKPKMSQHLWFYEGVTEYFANLFQVNQDLITENQFYDLMSAKIKSAADYSDSLSFTAMSKNILQQNMRGEYPNVYQKGALIAMSMDIILRENSKGNKGLLWLMSELTKKYGEGKAFKDDEFINTITAMTFPEIGAFLKAHVVGTQPIDYMYYLGKVGVKDSVVSAPESIVFISNDAIYINIDQEKKQVIVEQPDENNKFFTTLGLKNKDVLLTMNGMAFNPDDGSACVMLGYNLQEGDPVEMEILRNNIKITLKGKVALNYSDIQGMRFSDLSKYSLKNTWLKGQ
ncbi:MAG: peptidase M61 [Bacteroidota bacterium]